MKRIHLLCVALIATLPVLCACTVIAQEARNVALVPLEALRELATGQYSVFVVKSDDTLEVRQVQVGLKDLVNAEITSGVTPGATLSSSPAPGGRRPATSATGAPSGARSMTMRRSASFAVSSPSWRAIAAFAVQRPRRNSLLRFGKRSRAR